MAGAASHKPWWVDDYPDHYKLIQTECEILPVDGDPLGHFLVKGLDLAVDTTEEEEEVHCGADGVYAITEVVSYVEHTLESIWGAVMEKKKLNAGTKTESAEKLKKDAWRRSKNRWSTWRQQIEGRCTSRRRNFDDCPEGWQVLKEKPKQSASDAGAKNLKSKGYISPQNMIHLLMMCTETDRRNAALTYLQTKFAVTVSDSDVTTATSEPPSQEAPDGAAQIELVPVQPAHAQYKPLSEEELDRMERENNLLNERNRQHALHVDLIKQHHEQIALKSDKVFELMDKLNAYNIQLGEVDKARIRKHVLGVWTSQPAKKQCIDSSPNSPSRGTEDRPHHARPMDPSERQRINALTPTELESEPWLSVTQILTNVFNIAPSQAKILSQNSQQGSSIVNGYGYHVSIEYTKRHGGPPKSEKHNGTGPNVYNVQDVMNWITSFLEDKLILAKILAPRPAIPLN